MFQVSQIIPRGSLGDVQHAVPAVEDLRDLQKSLYPTYNSLKLFSLLTF